MELPIPLTLLLCMNVDVGECVVTVTVMVTITVIVGTQNIHVMLIPQHDQNPNNVFDVCLTVYTMKPIKSLHADVVVSSKGVSVSAMGGFSVLERIYTHAQQEL